ncbi:MAG: 2-hydroxychromene-2-carboxylate isomerase [Pseudomonadota bacterium]
MQPIDFYFDFASPYGYFMSEKIDALAAGHGRTVTWRPVLLFAALRALGLPAPLEHPVKLEYTTADFARSARFLGVDYRLPPSFPAVTQHAARAFYLLREHAPGAAVPFAHAALRGFFSGGLDITDLQVVAQLACDQTAALGDAGVVRNHLQAAEARTLLQDAIAAAVERKVFGSPFVIIDGEPFFGVDRLPQIAAKLAAGNQPRGHDSPGDKHEARPRQH